MLPSHRRRILVIRRVKTIPIEMTWREVFPNIYSWCAKSFRRCSEYDNNNITRHTN